MELEGGALVFDEIFMRSGYGYEIRCEVVGTAGTIELGPTARVVTRSGLKVSGDFPADWRGRFADAYRRELQTWVDAVTRWRSGDVKNDVGPVDGPDAWDGYRAALVAQTVLLTMAQGAPAVVEAMTLPESAKTSPRSLHEVCMKNANDNGLRRDFRKVRRGSCQAT